MGALHWQTGHVSQLLKGMDQGGLRTGDRSSRPYGERAARTARLFGGVFSTEDERAGQIPDELARARKELTEAVAELDELPAMVAAMFLGAVPGM